MKFLLIVVVGVVLWWMLRRPRVASRRDAQPQAPATFVSCAHCGVHLPAGDAVRDGEIHYCSDAHRLAGPKDGRPR
jgi:uncharacterized protein